MSAKYSIAAEIPNDGGLHSWVVDSGGKRLFIESAYEDLVKQMVTDANSASDVLTKKENISTSPEHSDGITVGNGSAIRDALESIAGYCKDCEADYCDVCSVTLTATQMQKARSALALPPRICDRQWDEDDFLHFVCAELRFEDYSFGWFAARRIIRLLLSPVEGCDNGNTTEHH